MSPGGLVSLPPDAPFDAEGSGAQGAGNAVVVGEVVTAVAADAVGPGAVEDGADAAWFGEFDEQATGRSTPNAIHPNPSAMKPVAKREPGAGHPRRIHANTRPTGRIAAFATIPARGRA